jgi:hypothetical protein
LSPALVAAVVTAYVIARYPHATMLVGRRTQLIEVPTWTVTTAATCLAAYFGLDQWYRAEESESASADGTR